MLVYIWVYYTICEFCCNTIMQEQVISRDAISRTTASRERKSGGWGLKMKEIFRFSQREKEGLHRSTETTISLMFWFIKLNWFTCLIIPIKTIKNLWRCAVVSATKTLAVVLWVARWELPECYLAHSTDAQFDWDVRNLVKPLDSLSQLCLNCYFYYCCLPLVFGIVLNEYTQHHYVVNVAQ